MRPLLVSALGLALVSFSANVAAQPPTSLREVLSTFVASSPVLGSYEVRRKEAEDERVRVSGAFDTNVSTSVGAQRSLLPSPTGVPTTAAYNDVGVQLGVSTLTRENVSAELGASTPLSSSLDPSTNPDQPQAWIAFKVPLLKLGHSAAPAAAERAAELHSAASGALLRDQRSELAMRVAAEYWRWVATYTQVTLMRRLSTLATDQLRDVDALIEQQARPRSDRLVFAAAADNAEANRIGAERAMFDQQRALWTLMGLQPPNAAAVPSEMLPELPASLVPAGVIAARAKQLAARRPLVAFLEGERQAAARTVDAARIALRPNVDLGVRAAMSRAQLGDDPASTGIGYFGLATLTFSMPIQNRSARGAYGVASGARAERTIEAVVRQRTIANTIDSLATDAAALAESYQRRLRAGAEFEAAYDAERERYRAGSVTAMEVLVAEQRFMSSNLSVLADRTAYAVALAQMLHETGLLGAALESRDVAAVAHDLATWPF